MSFSYRSTLLIEALGFPFTIARGALKTVLFSAVITALITYGAIKLEQIGVNRIEGIAFLSEQRFHLDRYISTIYSLLTFLGYAALLFTMAGLQAHFFWIHGKIPLWKYLTSTVRRSFDTFRTFLSLFRPALIICITPTIFYFIYAHYFSTKMSALERYSFLALATLTTLTIFWQNAERLAAFVIVPALQASRLQALHQGPPIIRTHRHTAASLLFCLLVCTTTLPLAKDLSLLKPYGAIVLMTVLILFIWLFMGALCYLTLQAVSPSQDQQPEESSADSTNVLYDRLRELFEESKKRFEEQKSYDIKNIKIEDEEQ